MNVDRMRKARANRRNVREQRERAEWLQGLTPEHRSKHVAVLLGLGYGLCGECIASGDLRHASLTRMTPL